MDDAFDNHKNISRNIISFVLIFLTDPNSDRQCFIIYLTTDALKIIQINRYELKVYCSNNKSFCFSVGSLNGGQQQMNQWPMSSNGSISQEGISYIIIKFKVFLFLFGDVAQQWVQFLMKNSNCKTFF